MTPKIYDILYLSNDLKTNKTQCSIFYLHKYIDELLNDGAISIYIMEKFGTKEIDIDKQEKNNIIIQNIIYFTDNIKEIR